MGVPLRKPPSPAAVEPWPLLPLDAWRDTYATLHMWTQIVGKIRMKLSPFQNHWWNVALYVTARGLTTSLIPYNDRAFQMEFDFIAHELTVETSEGTRRRIPLAPRSVADFYREVMSCLWSLAIEVEINTKPQEVPDPIPFDKDEQHRSYDPEFAHRCWRILLSASEALQEFLSSFIGKCSPVHFFWGSFDLACSRYNGRRAPERPGAITRKAYSHEVISAGFWPGCWWRSGDVQAPAFYSYTAPPPDGLARQRVRPASAFYHDKLGEFLLMYDDVRASPSPRKTLLDFFQSTYEAGANLAKWDRAELERKPEK